MPVTAKLSRKLYETFGDEDTNELVDLLNSVHTYRGDLRELNEANFVRFEAKLEQRLAELRRDLSIEISHAQQATLSELSHAQQVTLKWLFTFWVPTAVGIIGTAIAVGALLLRS
ncbi:MAG: hypothetical protein Q8R92_08335 [Deltaproteobacteria bacterium]|nr:hypothetical protein [Deltaproteobacteria bacterium]